MFTVAGARGRRGLWARTLRRLAAAALAAAGPSAGGAQQLAVGEIEITLRRDGAVGGGVLSYGGPERGFSISGLGVTGAEQPNVEAGGDVYSLRRLRDFDGDSAGPGRASGDGRRVGGLWLTKDDGVEIRLSSRRDGASVAVTGKAVYFRFDVPLN